jgi:hypothetical protein
LPDLSTAPEEELAPCAKRVAVDALRASRDSTIGKRHRVRICGDTIKGRETRTGRRKAEAPEQEDTDLRHEAQGLSASAAVAIATPVVLASEARALESKSNVVSHPIPRTPR